MFDPIKELILAAIALIATTLWWFFDPSAESRAAFGIAIAGAVAVAVDLVRRFVGRGSVSRGSEEREEENVEEVSPADAQKAEEIENLKTFGRKFSELTEMHRGYALAQIVSLSRITDLESWRRAQVDGTLKQFSKLCDARNSFMTSPESIGLMGSLGKIKKFIDDQRPEPSNEDLELEAAHKKWSEFTTELATTGPRNDDEVKKWLYLSRKFLDLYLSANEAKDRKTQQSIKDWIKTYAKVNRPQSA